MYNYLRYIQTKLDSYKYPEWYSEIKLEIVDPQKKTSLIIFRENKDKNSIVLVAPEAGHSSHIVDYGPKQSLVEAALNSTDLNVYVINKLPANYNHIGLGIEYCFESLYDLIDLHCKNKIHLVGLCQGGWQSAVVAARNPENFESLTIAAAPMDSKLGESVITKCVDTIPLAYYENVVIANCGLMPGSFILTGFLSASLPSIIKSEIKLYNESYDKELTDRYVRFNKWYFNTQCLPGKQYIEIVKDIFIDNNLDKFADFNNIDFQVNLVGGTKDDLTPTEQVFSFGSKCNGKVEYSIIDAGHIGVFMSKKGIKKYWMKLFSSFK